MNVKIKEIEEKLPKNCCSFCTHLSFKGPDRNFKYDIKCIISDSIPSPNGSCDYFQSEYSGLTSDDLDNLYINFLDTCLRIDFNEYLNSIYWQLFRENTLIQYDYKCCICGSSYDVDVYHTSKNLGRETADDIITLCSECIPNNE